MSPVNVNELPQTSGPQSALPRANVSTTAFQGDTTKWKLEL